MSIYWVVRGDSYEEAKQKVDSMTKEELAQLVFNENINNFIGKYADYDDENESHEDPRGHGKRIPYIGWYWRNVDWYNLVIPIGNCGDFIGVIENNKWGYKERLLTTEEAKQVMNIIWEAKVLSEKGGSVVEIIKSTEAKLDELWGLFQAFKI